MDSAKAHWEGVYATKAPTEVSWYQRHCALSLEFIARACAGRDAAIVDVGGGASTLVDDLLDAGYEASRSLTSRRWPSKPRACGSAAGRPASPGSRPTLAARRFLMAGTTSGTTGPSSTSH